MSESFLEGIKFGMGVLLVFLLAFSVYAVGFHQTNEIVPGTFQGDYSFNGSVEVGDNTSNKQLKVYGNTTVSKTINVEKLNANQAPNLVGELFVSKSLTKTGLSAGWHPTPYNTSSNYLEIPVNITNEKETYLVTVTQRIRGPSSKYWTGLEIINSSDDSTVKKIHLDGSSATTSDFGASSSIVISDLASGEYKFRVLNYISSSGDRDFKNQRNMAVYRLN